MVALNVIFSLLAFAVLVLLIVGFFSPKSSLFWMKDIEKRTRLKSFAVYFVAFILLEVVVVATSSDEPASQRVAETEEESTANADENRYIEGLAPVVVYGNLKEKGFKLHRSFNEFGYGWECEKKEGGIHYHAQVFSEKDKKKVESVKFTAMVEDVTADIMDAKPFFEYMATIPYHNADIEKVRKWINESYNKSDSLIVGNIVFALKVPSPMVRLLQMNRIDRYK